jgi:CRISPR-associated endonuclease/helicase Cas3
MNFYSHPNKLLEVHINGVLVKARKRTNLKIADVAVLFHDLGKINENFQKKLKAENQNKYLGYSEHAYLSMYSFLCFLDSNREFIKNILDNDIVQVKQIIAIIAKHHGNLPDFEDILSQEALLRLESYIKTNPYLPVSEFYENVLLQKHEAFKLRWNEKLLQQLPKFLNKDFTTWKSNALDYFLNTQFAFASLIEADKRDAGDNENYFLDETINQNITELKSSLQKIFDNLSRETSLNILRTQIRDEAIDDLVEGLKSENRIFSLTAPTGAGKTFMLLGLASKIQEKFTDLGVVYVVPFLSITDQVEDVCKKEIFAKAENVLSVNSKAINEKMQDIQADLESNSSDKNLNRLLEQDFISQTFDHTFIITTFVQLFETLVNNKNPTLLKLPNFSNRIFLIDEVQALPPRLYIFFAGWLEAFCRKHNSFAILSTATMPHFSIKVKDKLTDDKRADILFKNYIEPFPLIDAKKYFKEEVFNRYYINLIDDDAFFIAKLADHILLQDKSVLVILNTIKDTKKLYSLLKSDTNVYLLNTHFTPEDRRKKIDLVKVRLKANHKIILISTQLIEAGVDIDFPIVYRDLCPLPSLIQSAGRCNRNKNLQFGTVYFFHLINDNGKSSANMIYRNEAKQFLDFCKNKIKHGIKEKELFEVQEEFFRTIADDLSVGEVDIDFNMIECVNNAQFEKLGQFKLIEKKSFGNEYQYYIRKDDSDREYEKAEEILKLMMVAKEKDYKSSRRFKIQLNNQLKLLADRVITLRAFDDRSIPLSANNPEYFDMKVLANLSLYSFEEGLNHNSTENSFL